MKRILYVITILFILNKSNSYILLTANIEDVQSLAKQLATSPVINQVSNIWRRAVSQFQREVEEDLRRHAAESEEDSNEVPDNENMLRTKRIVKDLIAIAKNSGFIGHIKRALDIFNPQENV